MSPNYKDENMAVSNVPKIMNFFLSTKFPFLMSKTAINSEQSEHWNFFVLGLAGTLEDITASLTTVCSTTFLTIALSVSCREL